ncbi:virulence associated lipoprotein (plasmid) [Borreliella tanukii]|uniref:virulence associated lipoprotein n=1 Tax=Borreliella tanukii TaxID=56146 RepID=UPI00264A2033|nr:virulence associated lipoprotein [Borreliella tanukii]WKC81189.1 virulence associated lipoprotein [Borreliella tanukii]
MKYNIIASILVFLLLNACNPDFNTNQKDIKHQSSKKELRSNRKRLKSKKGLTPKTEVTPNQAVTLTQEKDPNHSAKNTLLDDLRNLIETANKDRKKYVKKIEEEPSDQYGIEAFKELFWQGSSETVATNTERSKNYRKSTYCTLNDIDISELKKLSEIIMLSNQTQGLFNILRGFGGILDEVIVRLYPKKDALGKLEISDLENLKNSFEKLLSIKASISEMLNQLLLDYQNDKNSIKKDSTELEFHIYTIFKQMLEKCEEAEKLKNDIFSIHNL